MSNNGVIYLAFGAPYLAMATVSAASVKAASPGTGVAVVTNQAAGTEDLEGLPFDYWIHQDAADETNRDYKVSINQYTPFDKTVFMDCDTLAVQDISPLFDYLDHFDMAMQLTGLLVGYQHADVEVLGGTKIGTLPHWNSGVIAFADRPVVHEFFDKWGASFERLGLQSDQPSCVEAVFSSKVRHLSIDPRWNSPVSSFFRARGTAAEEKFRIVHYTMKVITPDVEAAMYRVERGLVADGLIPDDGAVGRFIEAKHAARHKDADVYAAQELMPGGIPL